MRITHKYGIEIPTSWKHAKEIDACNKNHLWENALAKEIYLKLMKLYLLVRQKHLDI